MLEEYCVRKGINRETWEERWITCFTHQQPKIGGYILWDEKIQLNP